MRNWILLAVVFTFILAAAAPACGEEEDEVTEVPFSGTDTLTPIANGPLIDCAGAEPPSPAAAGIPRVYETQGPFSLMGETSGVWTAISCELNPDDILEVDGIAVIAGENGDQIWIRAHSEITATYEFTGHDLIIGGTGSLEGATGSIDVVGTVDLETLVATDEFTGTISTVDASE